MWHYSMDRSRIPSTKRVKAKEMPNTRWKLGGKKMKKRDKQVKDSEWIAMIVGVIAIVSIMILGITCN